MLICPGGREGENRALVCPQGLGSLQPLTLSAPHRRGVIPGFEEIHVSHTVILGVSQLHI